VSDRHEFTLSASYPNPFNASTTIVYELPSAMDITLDVYNILGQKVRTLKRGHTPAGEQRVYWDGKGDKGRALSSGVYLVRLHTPLGTSVRKAMMVK
jgi:flagellar hook assembly protein FlgD